MSGSSQLKIKILVIRERQRVIDVKTGMLVANDIVFHRISTPSIDLHVSTCKGQNEQNTGGHIN